MWEVARSSKVGRVVELRLSGLHCIWWGLNKDKLLQLPSSANFSASVSV